MMLLHAIKNLIQNTINSTRRFFISFCLIIFLFIILSYNIISNLHRDWVDVQPLISTIIFSIILCTLGTVLYEKCHERWGNRFHIKKIYVNLVLLVLSAITFIPNSYASDNTYISFGLLGFLAAMFLCLAYLSIKDSLSETFSYVLKSSVFNLFICGIISAGLSLCIYAFTSLILNTSSYYFSGSYKIQSVAMVFVWIVIFLNLMLTVIPDKDTKLSTPKAFKIAVLYAMLPTYILLLLILYVYLLRILITMDFPSGEINPLGSVASLMFIFFIFSLEQYRKENKLVELFIKYAGFFIVPIIAMQFWAIQIRVSAYGLTTARYISIVLNIAALTFAIVSLIKKGALVKYMLPIAAGVALIITLTPLNAVDVPVRNQTARLIALLEENNMISGGSIIPGTDVSREDRLNITSAFKYITTSDARQPELLAGIENDDFESVFGFRQLFSWDYERDDRIWVSYGCYCLNDKGINIEGFSGFYHFSIYNQSLIDEASGIIVNYDILDEIMKLYYEFGTDYHGPVEIYVNDKKLILNRVSFYVNEDNVFTFNSIEGFLLTSEVPESDISDTCK